MLGPALPSATSLLHFPFHSPLLLLASFPCFLSPLIFLQLPVFFSHFYSPFGLQEPKIGKEHVGHWVQCPAITGHRIIDVEPRGIRKNNPSVPARTQQVTRHLPKCPITNWRPLEERVENLQNYPMPQEKKQERPRLTQASFHFPFPFSLSPAFNFFTFPFLFSLSHFFLLITSIFTGSELSCVGLCTYT